MAPKTPASTNLSLLDTPNYKVREWIVVYHHRDPYRWFFKCLKPGFRHCELARAIPYGPGVDEVGWLHVLPCFEMLDVELSVDPTPPWVRCPGSTMQKVTAARLLTTVRDWFHIGPFTCVEMVKAALGIRSFWIRTPYQLYKYINRRNGVLISKR